MDAQIEHARGFGAVWNELSPIIPGSFLDLGSGGGLPGLVLLEEWQCSATFVDSMIKRTAFLREVLEWDGAPNGGRVITGRAESISREWGMGNAFDLVTARSFAPPSATAECAVRFLRVGGVLIVSEPPSDDEPSRWNPAALGQLGLKVEGRVRHGAAYQVLRKIRATPDKYPREIGVPGKNPLF